MLGSLLCLCSGTRACPSPLPLRLRQITALWSLLSLLFEYPHTPSERCQPCGKVSVEMCLDKAEKNKRPTTMS